MLIFQEYKNLVPYKVGYDIMLDAVEDALVNKNEKILLMEHEDVYTYGTGAEMHEMIHNFYNIPVISSNRGGKWTYHGPGQRMVYPIINLGLEHRQKDLKLYISTLESWIILTLKYLGVKAYRLDGLVGIWVEVNGLRAKIASIGIRVKKWVTYHGISINLSPDLSKFKAIIPCGISNVTITSLEALNISIKNEEFDLLLKKAANEIEL